MCLYCYLRERMRDHYFGLNSNVGGNVQSIRVFLCWFRISWYCRAFVAYYAADFAGGGVLCQIVTEIPSKITGTPIARAHYSGLGA